MCGELDDEEDERPLSSGDAFRRYMFNAEGLFDRPLSAQSDMSDLGTYMDRLFAAGLSGSLQDLAQASASDARDVMMAQPVVFARLAGFLAGRIPAGQDPLRQIIDALTTGYDEARETRRRGSLAHGGAHHGHDHDHDHDHDHGHDH